MDDIIFPKKYHNPVKLLSELKTKPESYWIKRGEKRALQLFHLMAERVPAYKDFLKKNKVNPRLIKTIKDFSQLPTIDKNNYLRVYPRKDLCWNGDFNNKRWTISTTSGSTGEPYYFPREETQDKYYALTAELYLLTNFNIRNKSTLYIDCFAMGAWIGGVFTYEAIKKLAKRGQYPLSIITPGIFKQEIINSIKYLGKDFDQIIIGGYPPFIKDLIDDAGANGINWKEYNVGFIFSAEGFTESFRDYITNKAHLKNQYTSTLNHYGTVDLGTMAHETPISILIRKIAVSDKRLQKSLFKDNYKLPTFAQYNPELFYFEAANNKLFCTSFSGLPLVRYDLKDRGGIISYDELFKTCYENEINLINESKNAQIEDTIWNLPFVFVFERDDFIVKLFGANIYPETIKKVLLKNELSEFVTGKFTMGISFDNNQDQFLDINIELKPGEKANLSLKNSVQNAIVQTLVAENSEYESNYKESPTRQRPHITFWKYEDNKYFKPGVKQKWVKK